ncbi:hypothetical protein ACFL3S_02790 [Gemmatimonadota bacterium]
MDIDLMMGLTASIILTLVVAVSVVSVVLLRPVSKHLGRYFEARAEERRALGGRPPEDWDRLFSAMETLADRLDALEDRQEFTEKLLTPPQRQPRDDS